MWIGDGQNLWEEIDFQPAGEGGNNYGWKCYEANHSFALAGCDDESAYVFLLPNTGTVSVPVATVLPADTVTEVLIFLHVWLLSVHRLCFRKLVVDQGRHGRRMK